MSKKRRSNIDILSKNINVLTKNKKLFVFPILSFLFCSILLCIYIIPIYFGLKIRIENLTAVAYLIVALTSYFMIASFVIGFMNASLIYSVNKIMNGAEVKIGEALSVASAYTLELLKFSFINVSFGSLLNSSRDYKHDDKKSLIRAMGGSNWNVLGYISIPLIIIEGLNFLESIEEGSKMLQRKWGRSLKINKTSNYFFGGFYIILMILALLGMFLIEYQTVLGAIILITSILISMFLICLEGAIKGITSTTLYRYLNEQDTGGYGTSKTIDSLFWEEK